MSLGMKIPLNTQDMGYKLYKLPIINIHGFYGMGNRINFGGVSLE